MKFAPQSFTTSPENYPFLAANQFTCQLSRMRLRHVGRLQTRGLVGWPGGPLPRVSGTESRPLRPSCETSYAHAQQKGRCWGSSKPINLPVATLRAGGSSSPASRAPQVLLLPDPALHLAHFG